MSFPSVPFFFQTITLNLAGLPCLISSLHLSEQLSTSESCKYTFNTSGCSCEVSCTVSCVCTQIMIRCREFGIVHLQCWRFYACLSLKHPAFLLPIRHNVITEFVGLLPPSLFMCIEEKICWHRDAIWFILGVYCKAACSDVLVWFECWNWS